MRVRDGRREKGGREEVVTKKEEWKQQERVEGGQEEEREGKRGEEGEGRKLGMAYLCEVWLQIALKPSDKAALQGKDAIFETPLITIYHLLLVLLQLEIAECTICIHPVVVRAGGRVTISIRLGVYVRIHPVVGGRVTTILSEFTPQYGPSIDYPNTSIIRTPLLSKLSNE